jgi:hypothetical protein
MRQAIAEMKPFKLDWMKEGGLRMGIQRLAIQCNVSTDDRALKTYNGLSTGARREYLDSVC